VQETEGFRTDVRVTNLSFLQTEWYIDQLLRPAYESEPLPIGWTPAQYYQLATNLAYVITKEEIENALRQNNIPPVSFGSYYDINAFRDTISLAKTLDNLKTGQKSPLQPFNLDDEQIIPGKVLSLDVDTAKVDWNALASRPSDKMYIDISDKQGIRLQEMMILEMLSNINDDNWQRSIHFATTITPSLYMNLQEGNFSLNGLTYQVVPGTPLSSGVNTEAAYDNMMNKFRWGGLEENPDIYLDETGRRMISTFRLYFTHLVNALLEEGQNEKALAVIDKANMMMPSSAVPYSTDGLLFARAYYRLGETEKAEAIITEISNRINDNLDWFERLKPLQISRTLSDVVYNNINPSLLITSIYQQYDKERYKVMADDLLQRAQFFYSQGISYVGDIILREITDTSVRGYYSISPEDTLARASEEETMQKALQMMQQFSPRLLEQYSTSTE
jgi:tetratricopeptide (TPR) repeat protein